MTVVPAIITTVVPAIITKNIFSLILSYADAPSILATFNAQEHKFTWNVGSLNLQSHEEMTSIFFAFTSQKYTQVWILLQKVFFLLTK